MSTQIKRNSIKKGTSKAQKQTKTMKANVASAANAFLVVVVSLFVCLLLFFYISLPGGFCHAPVVNFYDLKVM